MCMKKPHNIHPSRLHYQSDADARREIERVSLMSIPFGLAWIAAILVHYCL